MAKKVLKLENLKEGIFVERQNRFAGTIKYDGQIETAHIHDPGRLKELLQKGTKVLFNNSKGKLKYYIKAVKKNDEWILLDSALHSKIASKLFEILPEFSNIKKIKNEVPLGNSRIDFVLDDIPLEVKGVSLVVNNIALFPDAPTKRGRRHVREIIQHQGMIFFLIFRKAEQFKPNAKTDPEFAKLLAKARRQGIKIITAQISFDGQTIYYTGGVKLADF
ncbi:MAG: DNA/RNA nuclease SfsA [Promethearchaeota archaeon]|nr:MAG: DNA/RNA nuclease SfsA [Candidatus Lokiarchaeota archaeon]